MPSVFYIDILKYCEQGMLSAHSRLALTSSRISDQSHIPSSHFYNMRINLILFSCSGILMKYRNEVGLRRYDLMGCGLGPRLGLKRRPSVILVGHYLIVARAALTITMVNFRTRVIMLIMKGNHLKSTFWTI